MSAQPADLPDFSKFGAIERVPLRSIRRKIAQNMTQSWTHIPHVTTFDEADVTQLEALRAKHEAEVKAQGGRLDVDGFCHQSDCQRLEKISAIQCQLG